MNDRRARMGAVRKLMALALTARAPLHVAVLLTMLGLSACSPTKKAGKRVEPSAYAGPPFLRNTIGALSRYSNLDHIRVEGYGLVVNLDGTGGVVPPHLRQRMRITALKQRITAPDRLLSDLSTAVVAVEGLITPGATRGTRFDVLVSALPQTQVTDLARGMLWSTDLSRLGMVPTMDNRPLAVSNGPVYVSPIGQASGEDTIRGVVIGGGVVNDDRRIDLVLHQASYSRARAIADRINERFPRRSSTRRNDPHSDGRDAANAKSPSTIQIFIPRRYAQQPLEFLDLLRYLYLQVGPDFEVSKAQALAEVLLNQPQHAHDVVQAWVGLGRRAAARLKNYYDHPETHLRLSALEAGARLADERVAEPLERLSKHADATIRRQVAILLRHLPRSFRGPRTLHRLVDDEDVAVRLAAYESLAAIKDLAVQRTVFRTADGHPKFILDIVESGKPLIYVSARAPMPRVAIFDPMLDFGEHDLITLWDNRLMLRRDSPQLMKVYFQRRGAADGVQQEMVPAVGNLVFLLAHHPSDDHPTPGFDLQFGQVANVLYTLCQQRLIGADIQLERSGLMAALAAHPNLPGDGLRPEFGERVADR